MHIRVNVHVSTYMYVYLCTHVGIDIALIQMKDINHPWYTCTYIHTSYIHTYIHIEQKSVPLSYISRLPT